MYKRPVRSGAGTEKGALLAAAGSVFHHVVVYVKQGGEVTALEFGPANEMDITGGRRGGRLDAKKPSCLRVEPPARPSLGRLAARMQAQPRLHGAPGLPRPLQTT